MNFLARYALPGISLNYLTNWIGSQAAEDPMRSPFGYSSEERGLSQSARENINQIKNLVLTAGAGYQLYKGAKNLLPSSRTQPTQPTQEAPTVPIALPQEGAPGGAAQVITPQPQNPLQQILTPDVLQGLSKEKANQVSNRVRMIENLQANPTKDSAKQIDNLLDNIRNIVSEAPQKKGVIEEERERFAKAYPQQAAVQQAQAPVPAKQLKPFTGVPQNIADQFNKGLALAVNSLQQKPIRFRTEEGGYSTDLASIKKPTKSQTDSIFKRLVEADPSIATSLNKLSGPQRRIARNQLVGNFLDQAKGSPVPSQVQRIESARDKVQRLTESRRLNDLAKEREWLQEPAAIGSGSNYDLLLKMIREEL